MLSLKPSKSKSISKGIGRIDLDANPSFQRTLSTHTKEQPKRVSSISLLTKNTPSKQYRENKENSNVERKPFGIPSNSDYIKSLYRKYLGKESEGEKGERTMRPTDSQATIKELRDSTTLSSNGGLVKMNSYRESGGKSKHPIRSMSKKEAVFLEKQRRVEESEPIDLLELCDMEDSSIRALLILKQARKGN